MIAGYSSSFGALMLKTGGMWTSLDRDAWRYVTRFDSREEAEAEAVRLSVEPGGEAFDWISVKRARRPLEAGLRWGIQNRRRGSWRFHPDPTVRDGWSWHIFDAPVKILTFVTQAKAEEWLTMYKLATGERGRVVAAPMDIARREWGGERGRREPSG